MTRSRLKSFAGVVAALVAIPAAGMADTHTAPYLDAQGRCHLANGQPAAASVCAVRPVSAPPVAAPRCRDLTTHHLVVCGSPNSEQVPITY